MYEALDALELPLFPWHARPSRTSSGSSRPRSPADGSASVTPSPGITRLRDDVPVTVAGEGEHPIRVFLLDDHEVVRRGLRELLEAEPDIEVVGEAESAAAALRRIPALRIDVAVLDARLGDGSGIDVCREIRSQDESIRAIILTSYDDDDALFAAIMAGAAGYVLKQIHGTDLVDGIRRVAAASRCSTRPSSPEC